MGRDDRGRFAFAAKMRKPPRRNPGRDSPRAPSDSARPRTAWTPSGNPPVSRNGHRTRPGSAKSLIHKGAAVDVPSSTLAHAPAFPHARAFVELISHFLNCRVHLPQAICRSGPYDHPCGHLQAHPQEARSEPLHAPHEHERGHCPARAHRGAYRASTRCAVTCTKHTTRQSRKKDRLDVATIGFFWHSSLTRSKRGTEPASTDPCS